MRTATGVLVLSCEAYKASPKYLRVWFRDSFGLNVWRVCRDKSLGTAEAADTRSFAVELLSQAILACV